MDLGSLEELPGGHWGVSGHQPTVSLACIFPQCADVGTEWLESISLGLAMARRAQCSTRGLRDLSGYTREWV